MLKSLFAAALTQKSLFFKVKLRNAFVGARNVSFLKDESTFRKDNLSSMPQEADAVVIGAGSVGCSTAYHLSKLLGGNIILLEKHKITSGTTWHTAGILWCFKPSESETLMQLQTREIISNELPNRNGEDAGWLQTGSLHVLKNNEEYKSFMQSLSFAKPLGVKFNEIKKNEIHDLHPLLNTEDVHVAVESPGDGTMDPATYCMSYIKAVLNSGAKVNTVIENCAVTNIITKEDDFGCTRVSGVETDRGVIKTENVINCAGAWAPNIGKMVGVEIPQLTFKHAYVVTDAIPGILGTPIVKDHLAIYMKPQGSALQFGGYEINPHLVEKLPDDFSFGLYDLDWNSFEPHYVAAKNRIPTIQDTGIKTTICGPESFTPDGKPNMGESNIRGFYVNCGFNSGGMMLGGGAGRQLAHWVYRGKPEFDLFNCDIRRYPTSYNNYNRWLRENCHGKFAKRYSLVYKHDHSLSGRNQRLGPLHKIHMKHGALFGSKNGFERPAYYVIDDAGKPQTDLDVLPYDYYGCYDNEKHPSYPYCDEVLKDCTYQFPPKSHRLIGRECLTCRTSAAIFDTSSMSKYYVTGQDADLVIRRIFTRDVTEFGPGQFVYTLILNKNAGIEGDAIVTKIKDQKHGSKYYITTATSAEQYCWSFIEKLIADSKRNCQIENKTQERAIVSVQGPKSAEWLESVLSGVTLSQLRYGEWKEISIAGKTMLLGRLSFVGELGFEIHCRSDDVTEVHNALMRNARQYEACMAGYRAMESLSSETGFLHWPHSIKSSDNPVEAGLIKFCDDTSKYVGSDALKTLRSKQPAKQLLHFTVKCDVPLYGDEIIWKNGKIVGDVRTAAFAYALNCNIACGYVNLSCGTDDAITNGIYEIERMGVKYPAECHLHSPFDPKFLRMKGFYSDKEQESLISLFKQL